MSKQIGFGTTLSYGGTSGAAYTNLASIKEFTAAKRTVAKVQVDAFDNPTFNGLPVEDSIPGWIDRGTFGVKLWYDKSQYATLDSILGKTNYYKVIKSDGAGYIFTGFLSELSEGIPLKEAMESDATITINGSNVATFNTTQS